MCFEKFESKGRRLGRLLGAVGFGLATLMVFGGGCRGLAESSMATPADPEVLRSTAEAGSASDAIEVPVAAPDLYVLAPGDIISVSVYMERDLDTRARIARDGHIRMPLLGTIGVGGKTVEEATELIRGLLARDYLANPHVSISVVEYSRRRFTVLGQVERPGAYEIPAEETLNLLQAVALAGGYTRLAAPNRVTVQRTVGGEVRVFRLDARELARDERAKPFEILPDDTITVGERRF